jgi:hypothetical protein
MTIKKLKPVKPADAADVPAMPATGGATIADRFKLDLPDPNEAKARMVNKKATTVAFVVALIALGVAGVLTFVLYQHWEFLKGA